MMSHLTGRAKAWASAEWSQGSPLCNSLTDFKAALQRTFDPVMTDRERAQELSRLKQGSNSVCDYAIHFRTLAAESGWNTTALYDVFLKGHSRPSCAFGPTLRLGLPHRARHPDGQQGPPTPTTTRQPISREIHAHTSTVLAGSPPVTARAASSLSHGRGGRAHAAGKGSGDARGAKETTAGGPVFLLRRVRPSRRCLLSQEIHSGESVHRPKLRVTYPHHSQGNTPHCHITWCTYRLRGG